MRFAAKVARLLAALTVTATFGVTGSGRLAAAPPAHPALDPILQQRALDGSGQSRVIIRLSKDAPPGIAKVLLQQLRGTSGRSLAIINGHAGSLPNAALTALAASPFVERVSVDRLTVGTMERTGGATGAARVRELFGLDGAGVGVAIVDSGVTNWHDDLTGAADNAQRVDRFVDLVAQRAAAYDDYGHGTHVAGIVAGNGYDSSGARSGIAPRARLTVLKVLDNTGHGYVSDVIAALDYIVANKGALNIRVVNLSVMAAAYESYNTDPLTLAAKRVVDAGIVVVAAAGNAGRTATGAVIYGAIGAPANAPWVLTVGASTHNGTIDRADDAMAPFSSRGPAAGGYAAKPDIVAPGVGIVSLSDPLSAFYSVRSSYLLNGTVATSFSPYLSLSGTSMSAPVVSGTVALMLQANPSLTPNQVKAMLQFTAQVYSGYDPLTQGAGFLNARGAVELARYFANPSNVRYPSDWQWSRRLIWGNRLTRGGRLTADANAWSTSVIWGAKTASDGRSIEWGVTYTSDGDRRTWTLSSTSENVVWGTLCGGSDCTGQPWTTEAVFGSYVTANTVVWGLDDTVVWGMDYGMENETVVWGMDCADESCEPVIWSGQ